MFLSRLGNKPNRLIAELTHNIHRKITKTKLSNRERINHWKNRYLKSASNLNGNLNSSKELEHYASG